jgi:cbb3-type cytochrome oxidase subunit 3
LNSLINEFRNAVIGLIIILLGVPVYFYWKNKKR